MGLAPFAGSAAGAPPAPLPAETPDNANTAYTILPPGNGYIDGATQWNNNDQTGMYDGLDDPVADHKLTDADLAKYFKKESLAQKASLKDRTEDLKAPATTSSSAGTPSACRTCTARPPRTLPTAAATRRPKPAS
jgi:hypothetical protein